MTLAWRKGVTREQKVAHFAEILMDKGHGRSYAFEEADKDLEALENPSGPMAGECSVCRRNMTVIEDKYHYHPCE